MYSSHNLALNYIKPNYDRFATAAFPKRIPMTFIMLKMEFVSICNCYRCSEDLFLIFLG